MSTTTNWDDFKPIGNSPASSSGVNWGDFTPAPTRTLGGTARDVAVTAVKGAVGLPQAVVGLADIPTGGRVGKALEGAGVRFKDAQDALGEMYSPAQQAANRKVREADGFVGTAQAMLENPSTIATGIGESLPQMLGGAGVARGILAAAPRVGAVAAGALGEGVMGAGSAAEQIRGETDDGLLTGKQAALAGASGAATAALGALGGKVAQRLGVGDVDTMLAQGSTRAVGQGSTRSMPRQVIEGGVAEGALEELPQSIAEQALQNVALERPWDEGVGSAAAQGLITGAAMGGAGSGVGASANRAQQRADAQARQRTQAAIDSAEALTEEARKANTPLMLGNSAPDRLYVFPDGTTGRAGEVESYLANLPEDQQAEARARLMGQHYTEVNDPQAQQARRWWENYRQGETLAQGPDYLAEVQAAVRSGTPFTTRQTVDTVRDAMEDAWLAQNVKAEPAAPAPGAALQAADSMGAQLQGQFQQAGEDAGIAAVDARVRTGRILSGLQNLLDAGADNTARVLGGLNESLVRINEQPLDTAETQRVRRMVDAYMGFRGVGEAAPLPADRAPAVDPFADNAAMESLIPLRPSQRMGIDPAAGPLSKAAATAVDSGAGNVLPGAVSAQENANVQAAPAPLAVAAESVPAARALAMEAAGPASVPTTTGVTDGPQADQAQQAAAQPAQAGGAQAAEPVPGQAGAQATAGAPAPGALTDGAPAQDVGAPAAAPAAQAAQAGQAAAAAAEVAARPAGWRTSMLKARPVAKSLGIESQGKRLAQVVAEIDAADAQRAGVPQDGADLAAGQIDREWSAFAPETGTLGVPRAEMPQIRAEHRGALVNFLRARGIDSRAAEVPANDLKPTQAEFSPAKVARARSFQGGDRSILVSSDGYVVDGHHQWLAKRANGEPVNVIRLQAPIRELLAQVGEFPSTATANGASQPAAAVAPPGREVSREIGRYKEGLAEFRANQVRSELARKNPGLIYTVEEDASLKNGFAVVGREPAPGQRVGMERMKAARGRSPEAPKFSRGLRQPTDFVPNADGGLDYGEITPAMGKAMRRQAGTIRLQQGVQNADGSGHGLAHIEARHGKQIRGLGYESVQEFVADVARNIQEVWQAPGIQLLVTTKNGRKDVMYVQLEIAREGDFYRVNSAFPVRQADYEARQKMKRLWPESEPQAKATGQPSAFAVGNAETSSSADPNAITQSKDSVPPKAQDSKFRREGAGGRDMSPELAAAVLKAAQPAPGDPRSAARRLSDERLVATQQLVDGLKEKWTNAPEIIVARNMQDSQIPQDVRDYDAKLKSQGSTGEAEGFIVDGKVFLLADKLRDPNHIATVLFHEVLGHYGLNRAFGENMTPILNQVALARRAEVQAKARSYGLDWNNREDRLIAAEEVLAEMAQTNPQLTLVQRAIAAIRNWLRANVPGFKALAMTNNDIIEAFILPARGAVTRQNETMEQSIDRAISVAMGAPALSRDTKHAMATNEGVAGNNSGRPASDTSEGPAGRSFDNAKGEYNPELDTFWLTQAARDIGDGMADATREEYFTAVAERANLHRVGEILEELGWKRRGSSNISMSTYYTKEIGGEGDPDSWDFEPYTYEVRVSDHDDYHPPSDEIKERVQVNFRTATAQWSDIDLGPDLSNAEIRERLLSVLPNEPTASDGSDAPRFSRSAAVTPAAADYTPEQTRAAEHAFGAITKQTWAERAQSFRANLGTKLRQGIVDQFAPIKEVSAKAYMLARLSKGSDGAVEAALLYGKPFLRDGVYDVDMKDGGFAQVLAGLKGEHDRFFQWVAAQRAERLKAEGKENLLTDRDITALKSLNAGRFADGAPRMPAYAAALRELNAFNEAALKVAMESGLIDQAAYELMKDQPYVPFYRLMEEGDMRGPRFSSGLVNQQAWKKLKGGSQQLNADLLQNTLMNWSHLYAAAARNRASLETMAAADKMGIAYQVPSDTKGAVKVMRDGVAEHWAVEDPYLLDAIMAMSYAPGGLVKAMAPFKRLLTFGVTVNPTFKIRNLIRDSLSAVSQSDLGYNPFANVASGWKATGRDSQTYASMLASGGIIKFGTQENTSRVRAQIERLGGQMLDKQGFDKFTGQMKALWEAYEEFGDRTENVNRAALYERLIAKGHSHAEASFMARDLMDFSMSGKWEAVRFLAQTVPFLNARLQGLYKLGRAAKEDPRRFAAMAGAVSMASLGLMAAYGDDDDWKKREDWDRDAYWWFKVGNTAFRIPKPFELGSIGTLAERTAELMMSDEMTAKRFGARISDMVFNTFAMDPTPQFIKPFVDVYANKDSFSGRPIEGMADERLRPQDRYNERTSEIARLLGSWGLPDPVRLAKGEYSGLSPKQIDFLLRGYFGWLATVTTTATDMAARPVLDRGDRPAMRMRDTFLAGNFVEALPTGSSRYVTAMYEQARDVEQAWASYQAAVKSGDMDKAREIQQDEAPKLRNRLAIANAKRQIAELGQQAKRIEGSRLLSADQKREQLDAIEARKHQVAQRVAVTG